MDAEIRVGVGPHRGRAPAGSARQAAERLDRILVAALGVDRFSGSEIGAFAANADALALQARQMHLDARALAVEEGVMLEAGQIELGAKFTVDPRQQIE